MSVTPTAYEPVTSTIDHGTTRDGLVQARRRWQPSGEAHAAVLLLHGIAEHGGRYEHVGRRLADSGFETVAIDHRGYGQSGGRRGHVDRWSQFTDDVQDQLAEVRSLGKGVLMGGLGFHRQLIDGPVPCTGCHASGSGKRPVVTSIMYAQFNHNVRGYRYSAKHS